MLHRYKTLDIGFVILASDPNIGQLKGTIRSIKSHYPKSSYLCVVGKNTKADELKEIKELCPCVKGKDTITSLINTGISKGNKEWNILVMSGSWVRPNLDKKYSLYVESNKDVLFPIVTDYDIQGKPSKIYMSFDDCSLNGIMLHQKTFKEVGDFSDNPLEISRFMWMIQAQDMGVKFKAILGAKIC